MALFKILQGNSEDLKNLKATEGYAYFTPDDGKFYIDIATTANAEGVVVGPQATAENGVNRICINSGTASDGIKGVVINACALESEDQTVVVYDCLIPTDMLDDDIIKIECNPYI